MTTISIVVTNYNHGQYIQQAVASVEKQTVAPNLEIIIVDDGSTDESSETHLKDFEGRGYKVIRLGSNKGKWYALNRAIEGAKGTFIALQDADDVSSPQRLEWQLECLLENRSFHNLCLFNHCYTQSDIDRSASLEFEDSLRDKSLGHTEVLKEVHKGWKTPGINHYYIGPQYEAHGASTLFYKQHWEMGMKFLPGNMGLRSQVAEDSDHNTRMTLLLQKTSILLMPMYGYRRGSSTNPAFRESL
jgi:glycosyltransferase involved in cell wall biosynthesis